VSISRRVVRDAYLKRLEAYPTLRRSLDSASKNLSELNVRPPAAADCIGLTGIELAGNSVVAGMTGRPTGSATKRLPLFAVRNVAHGPSRLLMRCSDVVAIGGIVDIG
jgi:hypothetical protein